MGERYGAVCRPSRIVTACYPRRAVLLINDRLIVTLLIFFFFLVSVFLLIACIALELHECPYIVGLQNGKEPASLNTLCMLIFAGMLVSYMQHACTHGEQL
jgi:hypothetical protein